MMQAAGDGGTGFFAAAEEQSAALHRHLWAIGADADQCYDVKEAEGAHVLTSTSRARRRVYEMIQDYLDGGPNPCHESSRSPTARWAIRRGATTFRTRLRRSSVSSEIASGKRTVPRAPSGPLAPPSR